MLQNSFRQIIVVANFNLETRISVPDSSLPANCQSLTFDVLTTNMNSTSIPVNDPKHPRWLVDLEEWETIPFTEIPQETFLLEGYGVVSYAWGYIVDYSKSAPGFTLGRPRDQRMDPPRDKRYNEKIGCRYIWWDWMCVPQRGQGMRTLSP